MRGMVPPTPSPATLPTRTRGSSRLRGQVVFMYAFDIAYDMQRQGLRELLGQPVGTFQNSRFTLAEMETEVTIAEHYVDRAILQHNEGKFDVKDAAMAKWWTTELQKRVVDTCVQLHGGYGYMLEYPVAKAFIDSRVQTIYGGTTEIMKEIVGRSLGV